MDWTSILSSESSWVINSVIFLFLLFLGILLGRLSTYLLKKLFGKFEVNKKVSASFIGLFIVVVRWSIYISFLILAIRQIKLPAVTDFLTHGLLIIPALTSALVLIVIGFSIAIYLRNVVEDSEVMGWRVLSQTLFYFIFYVFILYAMMLALIPFDLLVRKVIIIAIACVLAVSTAFIIVKKELKDSYNRK